MARLKSKTLVIGSTQHNHVQCVTWEDALNLNLVDFDTIVVNVTSLNTATIEKLSTNYFRSIRKAFVRHLISGGKTIVLGCKTIRVNTNYETLTNYSWCPISIDLEIESGDTINFSHKRFPKFLSHFGRWTYWYSVLDQPAAIEFFDIYSLNARISIQQSPFARNRYGSFLTGEIIPHYVSKEISKQLGPIVLLPHIESLEQSKAVSLALEDLLGVPQTTLPPNWIKNVSIPLVPSLQEKIVEEEKIISSVTNRIAAYQSEIAKIEEYKKLLYASGKEFENIVAQCLTELDGSIKPARYSEEEFVLEYEGKTYLVECKGVSKSAALTHLRQIMGYMLKYEEDEGKKAAGILFVNAWKDVDPSHRDKKGNVFPDNVIERAKSLDIILVSSTSFYVLFCAFLEKRKTAHEVMGELISGGGNQSLRS